MKIVTHIVSLGVLAVVVLAQIVHMSLEGSFYTPGNVGGQNYGIHDFIAQLFALAGLILVCIWFYVTINSIGSKYKYALIEKVALFLSVLCFVTAAILDILRSQ